MANTFNKPNEYSSNDEKLSKEYALAYARFIEAQHFSNQSYMNRKEEWIENEAYRTGYQSDRKLKDKLLGEGKNTSFGKLDFTPYNIIPKFAKVAKKNLNLDLFESKTTAIDSSSMEMRKNNRDNLISKMINKNINARLTELTNIDFNPKGFVPSSQEEIDTFMEVEDKLPQEIAMEEAISVVKEANFHDEIKDRLADDVISFGMCVIKDDYDPELGVREKRINPIDFISSFDSSELNDNRNSFYNGHIEMVSLNDMKRIYGLKEEDALAFAKSTKQKTITKLANRNKWDDINGSLVEVLFFEFKTVMTKTYRKKVRKSGTVSIEEREDDFDFNSDNVTTYKQDKEVWIEGVWIVDSNIILNYGIRSNQVLDSLKKVRSSYSAYDTGEMSLIRKMIPFADNMNLYMIKMNQMVASARPKGVAINVSALLDIPNGAEGDGSMPYLAVVDRFDGTGNQLFRQDEFTAGQGLPLTELENGLPRDIGKYVDLWNHNLEQINNITGINPQMAGMGATARVSTDSNKLALDSSIKSIEFIKDAVLSVEKRLSENIVIRIQDIDKYDKPFKKYVNALGSYNLRSLMELDKLHPFTYSLYIEMKPSIEERENLNIDLQIALDRGQITVPDKIDIQNISNLKYAAMTLRRKIKENEEKAQEMELQRIEAGDTAKMAQLQAQMQLEQFKVNAESQLSRQNFEQNYELESMKLSGKINEQYIKANVATGKEYRDKSHDKEKLQFQQGQMNMRADKKLEAWEKGQLSKDSSKNLKK